MLIKLSSFFFNDTATTEIYTLSLHDALPISGCAGRTCTVARPVPPAGRSADEPRREERRPWRPSSTTRSEEHTSELQSRQYLVCRLLLEKNKNIHSTNSTSSSSVFYI